MPKGQLHETLRRLREELDQQEDLDPASVALLQEIHDEIETVLEISSEVPRTTRDSLRGRLGHAIGEFGASHPELARVMGRLADTLTGLGI